jgi:hypothetical protein
MTKLLTCYGAMVILLIAVLALVHVGAAQHQPDGTKPMALVGRVVSDDNGDPIRNAVVTISAPSAASVMVTTDGAGTFTLAGTVRCCAYFEVATGCHTPSTFTTNWPTGI